MTTKEVIILGCGPTHVECTYHCETWGVNGVFTLNPKRLDKLFMTDEESEVDASQYDYRQMVEHTRTLVLPVHYKKFQHLPIPVEIFPMEAILRRFPTRFYSNTIAYELAYALYHTRSAFDSDGVPHVVSGYNRIWFYGIDMMTHSTYVQEKGGVEFWMGVAMGMGVEIINTESSATGKCWDGKMYGHYGALEKEALSKGALYAPWELIRTSKASAPQDDWILVPETGEYVKHSPHKVVGEEVVR